MELTQKETMLLQDLKSQEQLCVEKYDKYAGQACDPKLKQLFTNIGGVEKEHLNTITEMLAGTVPMMAGGCTQQTEKPTASQCDETQKKQDSFLCQDALGTEKHVSGTYNTCIFEFKDAQARDMLNHIQKEEQEHGKQIYDYMAVNGMYA